MGKYKGERLNYTQALAIGAAVETGGASLEEVYWKVKMYTVISMLFREKGYTFDEPDVTFMINKSYETLHDIEGFPALVSVTFDQLAKVLLDSIMEKEMETRKREEVMEDYDELYRESRHEEMPRTQPSRYSDEIIDDFLNGPCYTNNAPEPERKTRKARKF